MDQRKKYQYHLLFSLAVLSVTLGAGLLVVTTEKEAGARVLWPLVFFAGGSLFAYFSTVARLKSKMLFIGLIVACSSLIRFGAALLGIGAAEYWPLYAVAAGICLLPVNYVRIGRMRPSSVVISSSFVLLGLFFSIFSFGFSSMRFKTFITRWWPALIIASGLLLFLAWYVQRLILNKVPETKPVADGARGDRGKA